MSDERVRQISKLQNEITKLEQAIEALATLPEAQQPLRVQLTAKQQQLAALLSGGVMPSVIQSGGVNFGSGNVITNSGDIFGGDKVMGDKFTGDKHVTEGPRVYAPINSGRDTNIATNQTINNTNNPQPIEAASLNSSDTSSVSSNDQLAPAEPTVPVTLPSGVVTVPMDAGAQLMLVIERGVGELRFRLLDGDRNPAATLPISDHDLEALAQQCREELRAIVSNKSAGYLTGVTIARDRAEADLQRLAQLGARVRRELFPDQRHDTAQLWSYLTERSQRGSTHIAIVADRVPLPWQVLYEGDPAQEIQAERFWGLRHVLSLQTSSTGTTPRPPSSGVGVEARVSTLTLMNQEIERTARRPLVYNQRQAFTDLGLDVTELNDEAGLLTAFQMGSAAQLVYFYCHVRSPLLRTSGPAPDMGETAIEPATPASAVTLRRLKDAAPPMAEPRLSSLPLVIVNACGSAQLTPLSYAGLVPYLFAIGARAVIGTEVVIPEQFGAAFGPALIKAIVEEKLPAGAALLATRQRFLSQDGPRNPLGLLYTYYGNPNLVVTFHATNMKAEAV